MNNKRLHFSLFFFFVLATMFAQMREYYPNSLEGKKERELKTELHRLIMVHDRIPYGSAYGSTWTVFRKSDVKPDGSIWDMYSNNTRYFPSGNTGSNRDMNIEHSIPKSWWGEGSDSRNFTYDASFDLHHLVPSDASANSAKLNYILGEVVNGETFNNGVSKVGRAVVNDHYSLAFEPADEYKGDFARMYLYLITCYQGEDIRGNSYNWRSEGTKMFENTDYPSLTTYGRSLLLKWSRQDPVSLKERNRNDAVYSFQKNRNPFIDYPELVEYIWGDKTSSPFYFPSARIQNYASGDYIAIPETSVGQSVVYTMNIKGENIVSNVSLTLGGNDKGYFILNPTFLTADALNGGTEVKITYRPVAAGFHKSTLKLSGGGLSEEITLNLRGVAAPSSVTRIYPVGLNAVYALTDAPVSLQLNISGSSVTWKGNGVVYKDGYRFNPAGAGAGTHYLTWKSGNASGKVKVIVK